MKLPPYQKFYYDGDYQQLRLLDSAFRTPVEQHVSKHIGRAWDVKQFRNMNDFASHPAAILTDGSYAVFAKLSEAANGLEQLEIEIAGLKLLSNLSGVMTPSLIGVVQAANGNILLFEAINATERTTEDWRRIGRTLAQIHKVKGRQYGLDTNGYFGPLYQDNRPMTNWSSFFTERRLWPRFMGAINSGNLPTTTIRQVEKLISRVPQRCGPEIIPTLLHGDAQQNNFISTETGAVIIDPAVYYGNPEMDLAYIDYFEPVPDDVFFAYKEIMPIDPGFKERRELWRVYGYLAAVEVEGSAYLEKLIEAVQKYL